MATEVLMPKLGATMESGTILKWFKQEGDIVEAGEPLVEIMTDKINIEVEAEASGCLLQIHYRADEEVPVNEVIAHIGEAGEQLPGKLRPAAPVSGPDAADLAQRPVSEEPAESQEKPRRTPAARKLARQHDVDLRLVEGTGPNGRIRRKDVERHIAAADSQVKATPLARKVAADRQIDLQEINGTGSNGKIVRDDVLKQAQVLPQAVQTAAADERERIKVQGIRKVVAQRMVQSAFSAPHVTLVSEVDMTNAMEVRRQLIARVEQQTGHRLSYTEIIMKFVASTLRKHPLVNASLQEDSIVLHSRVNVGLAVSVPNGLMVPVVRDADRLGLAALAAECKQLAALAREGKLQPDQLTGGTFTISNLGMYAIDAFTPIINQPESAILGVGRINEKPVGLDGSIVLRPMMTLSLSFDHRVIDGAPAAAFLTDLKAILENPYQSLV